MFWTIAVLLTLVIVAVTIYPLLRKERQLNSANAYDVTIYRSQLKEIDGDVERGLIDVAEAEAARAEVARRLIGAQDALDKEGQVQNGSTGAPDQEETSDSRNSNLKFAVVAVALLIPILSLGLYFALGSPNLEGQPLQARLSKPASEQSLSELVATAERKLAREPDDLVGWKKIAPIYARMRRTQDAIFAYSNILRLEGESVDALSDLGEVMVIRDAGVVSRKAKELFERANLLDAKAPKPRFFLAVALGQSGQEQEAIDEWASLVEDSPEGAPWVPFAKGQIAALEKRLSDAVAAGQNDTSGETAQQKASGGTSLSGPSQDDVEAASEMTAQERQDMVENMVANLAERLNSEGGSADEWVRLIRAELVLNRPDMAAKSVIRALDAMQSDVDGLEKVKAAARSLGLSINQ